MTERIFITELKVETVIGVFAWERRVRQTLLIDLEMATNISAAARHDDLDQALDYKQISKRLRQHIQASRCRLLETLAEQLVEILREEFGVTWLRLRLSKPGALRGARDVGLLLERGQSP